MTAIQHDPCIDVLVAQDVMTHRSARRGIAALRIGIGPTSLCAFFDKLLALGYATGKSAETGAVDRFGPDAWFNGGSPTLGFLSFGVPEDNPIKDTFTSIAGATGVDWMFMSGLLGIGLALTSASASDWPRSPARCCTC